ncbi:MAG: hypothetical protein IKA36_04565 [Clostridia bacterium]|nr:hypothetical protein [Clostridia bacterium]
MVLNDTEKKKLNLINEKIVNTNKRIMSRIEKLYCKCPYIIKDANDIDVDNIKTDDERLIQLIKYRNNLRAKYKSIAGRIWEEKYKEDSYEK